MQPSDETSAGRESIDCGNLHIPHGFGIDLLPQDFDTTSRITQAEAQRLEEQTRSQAASPLWHAERCKRLTASKFGDVCRKMDSINKTGKDVTEKFIKSMYTPASFNSSATSYGKTLEPRACTISWCLARRIIFTRGKVSILYERLIIDGSC